MTPASECKLFKMQMKIQKSVNIIWKQSKN